eukprot:GHVO01022209.1.p1 GENE.GHVO01022209.1~~GHVO01022209.1.p1  ORF type:complete len:224 (+),score=36.31 GHVO01022209.1:58-729(+)
MELHPSSVLEFMGSDKEEDTKAAELLGLRTAENEEAEQCTAAESDPGLLKMAQRLERTEDELGKFEAEMEAAVTADGDEEGLAVDRRSIYVGNVDYGSTPEELQDHFRSCGQINRITIMVDKFSGHPKGFAYVEFADIQSVANAALLSDSVFRGRQIKVIAKRKNVPGFLRGIRGGGRIRGFRGRGGFSGAPRRGGPPMRGGGFPKSYGPRYRGKFRQPRGPY